MIHIAPHPYLTRGPNKVFKWTIGRFDGFRPFKFCLSTVLEMLAQMHAPAEIADVLSLVLQLQGYIGGDFCIGTPFRMNDRGALQSTLVVEIEVFKDEVFST